jgi:predicted phage baseplate assembly protein
MPLNQHVPVIDDRRYSDILDELRTRIPRYTPEWKGWTDLNDSDPGITFSQLVAWLTEMMIYRMGKVPELNYIKFLELIGIELRAAQPAMAEIEFPVKEDYSKPYVIVPPRTQISAEAEDGGAPIVFETDRTLYALTAQLVSVQAYDGFSYRDETANNNKLSSYFPFGKAAKGGAAFYLGFRYPQPYLDALNPSEFPKLDLDLAVGVSNSEEQGRAALSCSPNVSGQYASAKIVWESWNGNEWQRLALVKDETLAFTRSGHIVLRTPAPGVLKLVKVGDLGAVQEGYFIRGRLERSAYERAPELVTIRSNTTKATQAETAQDEVLGGSNGRRDQVLTLSSRPVLLDSLKLEIDEGDGFQPWVRVDDFFGSKVDDTHYVLNPSTGEVRLGGVRFDGVLHGHVPVANPLNPGANIVAREYRFGGGKRGNVKSGALSTVVTSIEGIDDGKVINRFAAHSGRDEEAVEEVKTRASRSVRSRFRAVTVEDFEQLAQESGNVKRAKALPLHHPSFPDTSIPGAISVIIVPDSEATQPMPSEGTLRTVCAYLNDRRLLTAEVYVLRPTYQLVEVRGDIIAADDADLSEVKQRIEEALIHYFHPLKGGDDGKGWPFGGTIFYSKVVHRLFNVPGVSRIEELDIYVDREKKERCADVDLRANALTYSTEHHVDVHYTEETA